MYKGEDLIIATGAPGSRWSGAIRCLQSQVDINITDEVNSDSYSNGNFGWHRGVYWGPHHQYGHHFDRLDQMDYSEVLREFKAPFQEWQPGIKVVKSHWFSYHIPQLCEWFPEAKILTFWLEDDFCFDWWHKVGGWNITYPHYDWYVNDERMKQQISIENSNIKKYSVVRNRPVKELLEMLELKSTIHTDDVLCSRDIKFSSLSERKPLNLVINDTIQRVYTGVINPAILP